MEHAKQRDKERMAFSALPPEPHSDTVPNKGISVMLRIGPRAT